MMKSTTHLAAGHLLAAGFAMIRRPIHLFGVVVVPQRDPREPTPQADMPVIGKKSKVP